MNPSGAKDQATGRWRARPEKWWWITLIVVLPMVLLIAITTTLLIVTTNPATATDEIDLVKTALSVGAGTGGVVALMFPAAASGMLRGPTGPSSTMPLNDGSQTCTPRPMPYDPPTTAPGDDATRDVSDAYRNAVQERQVRLTAQRIGRIHLEPGTDLEHPADAFRPDLDLTGATLLDPGVTRQWTRKISPHRPPSRAP